MATNPQPEITSVSEWSITPPACCPWCKAESDPAHLKPDQGEVARYKCGTRLYHDDSGIPNNFTRSTPCIERSEVRT